jgi:DNA-directed RNA polymerase
MFCAGQDAFEAQTNEAMRKGGGSWTPGGRSLLDDAVEKVRDGIVSWLRDCQRRERERGRKSEAYAALGDKKTGPGADEIALAATRTMLNTALAGATGKAAAAGYHWPTAQAMFESIGHEVELRAKLAAFESQHGRLRNQGGPIWKIKYRFAKAMKRARFVWPAWSKRRLMHVGARCYRIIEDSTGVVQCVQRDWDGHRLEECRLTDDAIKRLSDKNEQSALRSARHLPMVCPPSPWLNTEDGGYLCKEWLPSRIIRHGHRDQLEGVSSTTCPKVFAALNQIQATPWRINRRVLDVALALEKQGLFPLDKDVKNKNKEGKRSLVAQAHAILRQADRFAGEERFWLPASMDFRGRIYYGCPLNPQGSKLARALLEFADPVPTASDGEQAFARYGVKLHGLESVAELKLTGAGSLTWVDVERYFDAIRDASESYARDPLNRTDWQKVKEPWLYLAWCFARVYDGWPSMGWPSHFPLYLDATASGMQHLSALLRDERTAELVNIVDPYDGEDPPPWVFEDPRPQDLYAEAANRLRQRIEASHEDEVLFWQRKGIDPGITKSPTMTLLYGSTHYGRTRQIEGRLRRQREAGLTIEERKAARWLEVQLDKVNRKLARRPAAFMRKLRAKTRALAEKGQHLEWTAPSGFPVRQRKFKMNESRIKLPGIRPRIHEPADEISKTKSANSAVANFVHSLDAAYLVRVVNALAAEGVTHVGVVHDSLAVHVGNAMRLRRCARDMFADMYSQDLLEEYGRHLSMNLRPGRLNVFRLKHARYLMI